MKRIIKYLCAFLLFIMCTPLNVFADLHYVGCGSMEGIPQPLVQLTRMVYNFLVVITPIVLVAFSVIRMIRALKEDNADEVVKAKNSLVKKFIAAGIILSVGVVSRFILTQVATNKDDKNTAIACMRCFLYNKDCHESSSGNGVKRGFYNQEPDSDFINDTKENRANYKPANPNATAGQGLLIYHKRNDESKVKKDIFDKFWGIEVDIYKNDETYILVSYHPSIEYTLKEFLTECKEAGVIAILDLKNTMPYSELVGIVKDAGMFGSTIFQSSDVSVINSIYEQDNSAVIWLLNSESYGLLRKEEIEKIKDKISGINIIYGSASEGAVEYAHNLGLKMCVFKYNVYENTEEIKSWGTDFIEDLGY